MDDELKAIQDDLDNVLERLDDYIRSSHGELTPSRKNAESLPKHAISPSVDTVRVVSQYVHGRRGQILHTI